MYLLLPTPCSTSVKDFRASVVKVLDLLARHSSLDLFIAYNHPGPDCSAPVLNTTHRITIAAVATCFSKRVADMGDLGSHMAEGDATTPRRCNLDEEATTPTEAAATPARARRRRTHNLSRCAFLLSLRGCSGGWVDPDTPTKHLKTKSLRRPEAGDYELVYSDEFEVAGRTFDDGHDPRLSLIHI